MPAETTKLQDSRLGKDLTSAQNEALRGAAKAFRSPPVKPKPQIDNYSGKNGALAAATKVGPATHAATRKTLKYPLSAATDEQRLTYQRSGESNGSGYYMGDLDRIGLQRPLAQLERRGDGHLHLPESKSGHFKSPSFIAATLATSRSTPASPNRTGRQQLSTSVAQNQSGYGVRSPSSVRSLSSSRASSDRILNTKPPVLARPLIEMFEKNAASPQTPTKPVLKIPPSSAPILRPPKPQKPSSFVRDRGPSPSLVKCQNSQTTALQATSELPISRSSTKFDPPDTRTVVQNTPIVSTKPIPIPYRPRSPKAQNDDDDDVSSNHSFFSASSSKPSFRAAVQNRRPMSTPGASATSSVAIDSLANAIVASSLASSRAASPYKSSTSTSLYPPPPPPSRRSPRAHLFPSSRDASRTPSPAKPPVFRTTMRNPKAEDEVDEGEKRRGKKNLMKKHPNKHHEGDRKRWRDEITQRERKRYEAVWASNKGLYASTFSEPETSVCNLVVRDVYSRSRLSADVLEEVYALIDRQQNGRLEREEFVVGLWLIDQRLKGRKLPIRVTDSVWRSVGVLGEIKVKRIGR